MEQHYLDHVEKIKVYKELIFKNIVRDGKYPTRRYIDQLVSDIDLRLAIFDYKRVNSDTKVDVEKLNSDLLAIYKDLSILYKIIYRIQEEKYIALESMIHGYLTSLEAIADEAEKIATSETEETSLGTTIFYSGNNPAFSYDHGIATFDLGFITCEDQSILSFWINGQGFEKKDCVLILSDSMAISPYEVNKDIVKINEGNETLVNTYTYQLDENEIRSGVFVISSEDFYPDNQCDYMVFGNKKSISILHSSHTILQKYASSFSAEDNVRIDFYLTGAKYIHFEFSQEPLDANFSSSEIEGLDPEAFYLYEFRVAAGTNFNFKTDGDIFATKEEWFISENRLCLTNKTPATDFTIYEFAPGSPVILEDVKVQIYNVDENNFKVDDISIKQLTKIQAVNKIGEGSS